MRSVNPFASGGDVDVKESKVMILWATENE
jgi:hypothetical protein